MSTFNIKQVAISSVGALALSATCVFAAVGPARAANAPLTTGDWQQAVSQRISSETDSAAAQVHPGKVAETVLALHFTPQGDYAGASVAQSSGNTGIDRHAVALARAVRYPALPAGYRGAAQTVEMRLVFGDEAAVAKRLTKVGSVSVEYAAARNGGTQIAGK